MGRSGRKPSNRTLHLFERQKPVTDKYRDNYDRIFRKKPKCNYCDDAKDTDEYKVNCPKCGPDSARVVADSEHPIRLKTSAAEFLGAKDKCCGNYGDGLCPGCPCEGEDNGK